MYTTIQVENGYVVAGVNVKKVDKNVEINAISTVFNKDGEITNKETIIYESEKITPQQKALLARPNFSQYQSVEELSAGKSTENIPNAQAIEEKNTEVDLQSQIDKEKADLAYRERNH